jgi:hypothetical protein
VEEACLEKEDIGKSYCEGDKVLMVHGGANKAGRFLEVSWRFLFTRREVVKESYGSRIVGSEGAGIILRESCALWWFPLELRMGWSRLGLSLC